MPKQKPLPTRAEGDHCVKTRRVHYIGGFDPRGARAYHRIYREESEKQLVHQPGATMEVGPRKKLSDFVHAWEVKWKRDAEEVKTEYQYMVWDDLVREHWIEGLPKLVLWTIHFYWFYIGTGALRRVRLASRQTWYSGVFPPLFLLLLAIAVLLAGCAATALVSGLTGIWWLGILAGLAAGYGLARPGLKLGEKWCVMWLLRTYIFTYALGDRPLPDVQARIDAFADWILKEQEANPVDEVLIAGHSTGSYIAVSAMARLLRKRPNGTFPKGLHLMTLGECLPLLGFVRGAKAFREELKEVSAETRLLWTDIAVPADPLCFYPANPARACHIESTPADRPNRVVARIFRMFSEEAYAKIRMNKQRIHFQYLMASELPSDYDYFWITAGPSSLASCSATER